MRNLNAPNIFFNEFKMEGYLTKYYNNIFKSDCIRYYIIDFQNGNLKMYKNMPKKDEEYESINFRDIQICGLAGQEDHRNYYG